MLECCDNPVHLCLFPTELIIYIFKFLSVKNLIACRQVCKRWREVVDNITCDDHLWLAHCETDFKTIFQDAKQKSSSLCLWYDVYRSLTLWCRLSDATETRDEFCHSSKSADQVEDACILKNGVASVVTRTTVAYYDIMTLEATGRTPVAGEFAKFVEIDDVLIVLGELLHLRIIRKRKHGNLARDGESVLKAEEKLVFRNVKHFRIFGKSVFFINIENEIYHCDLNMKLAAVRLPKNHTENVITLSMYNGFLHALTAERHVYKFENDKFVLQFNLETKKDNLFDCLWHYQFIENLNWRLFYFWMANICKTQPQSPLGYICLMKVYGDVFFIGCKNGVFLIYFKPYTNGHLDLFNHNPVKQYNFGEREDIPVLSLHPIISIDVLEMKEGHKVLVGMPKKVIVLTFEHNFEVVKSKAVIPYVPPIPVALKDDEMQ